MVTIANACFLEPDKESFKDPRYASQRSRGGLYYRFFQWLQESRAKVIRLPKGSFSNADRTTLVDTVIITASKPITQAT